VAKASDRSQAKDAAGNKTGGSGKTIAIVAAAVLLLGCCCLGVPGGVVGFGWWKLGWFDGKKGVGVAVKDRPVKEGGGNPLKPPVVTLDGYNRIEFGMTLAELEQLLGSGKTVTEDDVSKVHVSFNQPDEINRQWGTAVKDSQVASWAEWRNGKELIHVGFRQSKAGDLATLKALVINSTKIPGGTETHTNSKPAIVDLVVYRQQKGLGLVKK
jgi:hypothetical protein